MKLTAHLALVVPDNIHPKSIAQLLNYVLEAFREHRRNVPLAHPARAFVTGAGVVAFQVNGGPVTHRPVRKPVAKGQAQ